MLCTTALEIISVESFLPKLNLLKKTVSFPPAKPFAKNKKMSIEEPLVFDNLKYMAVKKTPKILL